MNILLKLNYKKMIIKYIIILVFVTISYTKSLETNVTQSSRCKCGNSAPLTYIPPNLEYNLTPIKIAKNTYMFKGDLNYFNRKNGGDISNTAFIITESGVIVIDTGSSYRYAKAMIREISKITNKKITDVINTHHHPDHFLGNSAFKSAKIWASKITKENISKYGDNYINTLTNLVFDWMKGTTLKVPDHILTENYLKVGNYKLKILYLNGHTKSDIAIYDENTKTLFASDLLFYNRAAATPHANIQKWINSLKKLQKLDYKVIVTGHGSIAKDNKSFIQMIKYLSYLDKIMKDGIRKNKSVFEILQGKQPKEFKNIHLFKKERQRSVIAFYPKYEEMDYD